MRKITQKTITRVNSYKRSLLFNMTPPKDLAELVHRMVFRNIRVHYGNQDGSIGAQQPSGDARSAEDMYRVAKSYNPKIDYENFIKALESITYCGKPKLNNTILHVDYCVTVKRLVHSPSSLSTTIERIRQALGKNNIKF
jgi:hypothetical protein